MYITGSCIITIQIHSYSRLSKKLRNVHMCLDIFSYGIYYCMRGSIQAIPFMVGLAPSVWMRMIMKVIKRCGSTCSYQLREDNASENDEES